MTGTDEGQESTSAGGTSGSDDGDDAFSLQAFVDSIEWSPHEDALGQWKQTHVLADLPLTWLAPAGADPLTGLDSGFHSETEGAEAGPVWIENTFDAVICSQTCDLGATAPGTNHPFALVAPLLHESQLGNKQRNDAAKGMLSHLVRILPADPQARHDALEAAAETQRRQFARTLGAEGEERPAEEIETLPPPTLADIPRGHRWYADLRLLVPISKGLLLGRKPAEGFITEEESLAFGEILAQKFRRPALHEALSEDLPKVLEQYVQNAGASRQPFVKVEQVRLHIIAGDRLNPVRGRLVVLTEDGELTEDEQASWQDLNKHAAVVFGEHDINYAPLVHYDVTKMPASLYRRTVPVRCRHIGHARWA